MKILEQSWVVSLSNFVPSHHLCKPRDVWHYSAQKFWLLVTYGLWRNFRLVLRLYYTSSWHPYLCRRYMNVTGWLCAPKDPMINMVEENYIEWLGLSPFRGWEDKIYCLRYPYDLLLFYFFFPRKSKRELGRTSPVVGTDEDTFIWTLFSKGRIFSSDPHDLHGPEVLKDVGLSLFSLRILTKRCMRWISQPHILNYNYRLTTHYSFSQRALDLYLFQLGFLNV